MFAALALSLAARAVALGVPENVARGIPHQALYAAAFDGARGVAVGAYGEILATADGGARWTQEKSPSELSLLGVVTQDGRSIAVGQMGLVLVQDHAGSDWRQVKVETAERLLAVDMNRKGLAFAVGSFGTVLKSSDGGASWSAAAPDWGPMFAAENATLGEAFHPHLYTVRVDEQGRVIIAGELSFILASEDAGAHWRAVHSGVSTDAHIDPSIFGLALRADGVGFAVGQTGAAYKTTDNGKSWSTLATGTDVNLLGVETRNADEVLFTGMREMLQSRDDGATWQRVEGADLDSAWYAAAVQPAPDAAVIVVGQSGQILSIPDARRNP